MENTLIPQPIPNKENQLVLRKINLDRTQQTPSSFSESFLNSIEPYFPSPGFLKHSECTKKPGNKLYEFNSFIQIFS